mgnify:CR=1 FL=1
MPPLACGLAPIRFSLSGINSLIPLFKVPLGWQPIIVEHVTDALTHELMAKALDTATEKILQIKKNALENKDTTRPMWPMII